jgi:4'-phosphopantetheinyl transferase
LEALLSSEERDRAARFRFDRDRIRFIGRRGLLRRLLGRYLGCHPAAVQIGHHRYGKPRLVGALERTGLRFNATHSADVVFFATTRGREVGVDVERIRPLPDANDLAERHFPPAEVRVLRTLPPRERSERFLEYWTRREAYGKATGEGLGVLERREKVGDVCRTGESARWTYRQLRPFRSYVGALVVEGSGWRMQCRPLSWSWVSSSADVACPQPSAALAAREHDAV